MKRPQKQGLVLAEQLRRQKPSMSLVMGGPGNPKSQFKKADQSGAQIAIVIGETELEQGQISLKFLRENKEQITLKMADFV